MKASATEVVEFESLRILRDISTTESEGTFV